MLDDKTEDEAAMDIARVRACTICRDIQKFDLLIEDMDAALGDDWGVLSPEEAELFLSQPDAGGLDFIAIAIDKTDELDPSRYARLAQAAAKLRVGIVVIAENVGPLSLHRILSSGPAELVPYPLPAGALDAAIGRLAARDVPPAPTVFPATPHAAPLPNAGGTLDGVVLSVHSMAGGVGATTFSVNLAWELATISKDKAPRVCLLDLDLQGGAVATYLDLTQRESVAELLGDTAAMDGESFCQALQTVRDRLHVLTTPAEMVPLDLIGPEDVSRLIDCATEHFDYVVIDMPTAVVGWTETVIARAHVHFAMLESDMRSAQNTLRMIRALKSEDLPVDKLRYVLNRGPTFTDLSGKSRVRRLAESLDISIDVQLPDGGRAVTDANDQGMPLAESARKSPLRRAIQKIAGSLHELSLATAET